MENVKKTIRSNKAQINYLCQYMSQHPEFAAGDYKSPLGARQLRAEWEGLKQALDELGPNRTVDQWKICWRDQKKKAREEGGALNRVRSTTGNVGELPELSGNSELVLGAIGQEMAVGCGPEEASIGFTEATTPLPTTGPMCPVNAPSSSGMQMPAPRASVPRARPRRARRVLLPDQFISAQLELNNLLKDLITEIRRGQDALVAEVRRGQDALIAEARRGNELRQEHLNLLRGAPGPAAPGPADLP